jgi:tetratricopeptide (TPR) repeat protein
VAECGLNVGNLAILDYDEGHWLKARQVYKQAIDIYQRLAAQTAGVHSADFARTLTNFANHVGQFGAVEIYEHSWVEADAHIREALAMYQQLNQKYPNAYLNDLAVNFGNLDEQAWICNALGRLEKELSHFHEARQYHEQAIGIYQELLSAVYSDAYLVELARSFEQLSAVHVMQQNWSEAQQLCVQALGAYTQVQSNSDQDFS